MSWKNRLKVEEKREQVKKKKPDTNEKLHSETTTKDRKGADVENTIISMFLSLSVFFLGAYLINASFR